jgi:hypothetical protein
MAAAIPVDKLNSDICVVATVSIIMILLMYVFITRLRGRTV